MRIFRWDYGDFGIAVAIHCAWPGDSDDIYYMPYMEIIQLGLLVFAVVGLFLTFRQSRTANRQKSIEYILNLVQHHAGRKEMLDAYYAIEYGQFTYDASFHNSPLEKEIDALLGYYDTVARVYRAGQLRIRDLEFMAYAFVVIYRNTEIRKYLEFLDGLYMRKGIRTKPFGAFRLVGRRLAKTYAANPVPPLGPSRAAVRS